MSYIASTVVYTKLRSICLKLLGKFASRLLITTTVSGNYSDTIYTSFRRVLSGTTLLFARAIQYNEYATTTPPNSPTLDNTHV